MNDDSTENLNVGVGEEKKWGGKLWVKLALIMLAFSAVVTTLLFILNSHENSTIELVVKEREGVDALSQLNRIRPELNFKEIAALSPSGQSSIIRRICSAPDSELIENYVQTSTNAEVDSLRHVATSISRNEEKFTIDVFNRIVFLFNRCYRDIGDRSNLVLDPELDSAYTSDLLLSNLPVQYALIQDLIASDPKDVAGRLSKSVALNEQLLLQRDLMRSIESKRRFFESSSEFESATKSAASVQKVIANPGNAKLLAQSEYLLLRTIRDTETLLRTILDERYVRLVGKKTAMNFFMVALWMIALAYGGRLTSHIVWHTNRLATHIDSLQQNDILEIGEGIKALAEGDWTRDVRPNYSRQLTEIETEGALELVQIGQSLNRTAAQIRTSIGYLNSTRDKLRQSTEALAASEQRFKSMVSGLGEGVLITDGNDVIQYANAKALELLGRELADIEGIPITTILDHAEWKLIRSRAEVFEESGTRGHETVIERKGGEPFEAEIIATPFPYQSTDNQKGVNSFGMIAAILDISHRKKYEYQLWHQALHDKLTGLPNRALFLDRVQQAHYRHERLTKRFAVLFIDLDNFKVINDSLGHKAGDELLIEISRRLRSSVRDKDTVARLGGDEFTILLEEISNDEMVMEVVRRIRTHFSTPIDLGGNQVMSGGSIGIAFSDPYLSVDDLVRNADIAMYQAKAAGKHQHVVFDEHMREKVELRLKLENDLRHALENDELLVQYQPSYSVDQSRLVEVEALVRWQHPELGIIPPKEFIPIAEECGLIIAVGNYVMLEAAKFGVEYNLRVPKAEQICVSVNLSAIQLRSDQLIPSIKRVLVESGLRPDQLKLEITESMLMKDTKKVVAVMNELKKLGIKLAMDNFGTGYSSMSQLKDMPIDTLKIDRSFISQLDSIDSQDHAIVNAIINMAKSLRMSVTSEGIETDLQFGLLKDMGCDQVQGFLYSPAVDGSKLLRPTKKPRVA